ncbi:unnamed protein product [Bursaphelenchus okinawaensis]|uniref:Uncharacterized protein n=1 Tax=Bursaphelenchus okinawaensis TaxID=465554 RepID=A0A811KYC0_9BILA|nr:unnamed protein product [Bursaphelenchus okinawaensis]CAG9115344.1 unnamed protein product [Bursaphelenchus okinawaensis]
MAYSNPACKPVPVVTTPINGVVLIIKYLFFITSFVWQATVRLCNYFEIRLIPRYFSIQLEAPLLRKVSKLLAVHDHLKDGSTFSGRLSQVVQAAQYQPRRKMATFRSTRRNIFELQSLLELILPMFGEYPWNQLVPNAGLNMAVLCGLIRKLLKEDESLATQPKTVTAAVTDDYHRWCSVLEVEHLTFGLSDMVEEVLFNYRFHMNRNGKMSGFDKLPTEIQCMIMQKVHVPLSQQFIRDDKKALRRVWYGNENKRADKAAFLANFVRINAKTATVAKAVLLH